MAANKTPFLALNQWEADDPVLRADFNADNAALDAFLMGTPEIAVGSYVGTGGEGSGSPNTLTFPFSPQMVVISKNTLTDLSLGTVMIRGQTKNPGIGHIDSSAYGFNLSLTWTDNSLTWYSSQASDQLNSSGGTYYWFAIGV